METARSLAHLGGRVILVGRNPAKTRRVAAEIREATGADVSQADPGEFSASKESDLSIIRIGEERYEIPDGVIYGG